MDYFLSHFENFSTSFQQFLAIFLALKPIKVANFLIKFELKLHFLYILNFFSIYSRFRVVAIKSWNQIANLITLIGFDLATKCCIASILMVKFISNSISA